MQPRCLSWRLTVSRHEAHAKERGDRGRARQVKERLGVVKAALRRGGEVPVGALAEHEPAVLVNVRRVRGRDAGALGALHAAGDKVVVRVAVDVWRDPLLDAGVEVAVAGVLPGLRLARRVLLRLAAFALQHPVGAVGVRVARVAAAVRRVARRAAGLDEGDLRGGVGRGHDVRDRGAGVLLLRRRHRSVAVKRDGICNGDAFCVSGTDSKQLEKVSLFYSSGCSQDRGPTARRRRRRSCPPDPR